MKFILDTIPINFQPNLAKHNYRDYYSESIGIDIDLFPFHS